MCLSASSYWALCVFFFCFFLFNFLSLQMNADMRTSFYFALHLLSSFWIVWQFLFIFFWCANEYSARTRKSMRERAFKRAPCQRSVKFECMHHKHDPLCKNKKYEEVTEWKSKYNKTGHRRRRRGKKTRFIIWWKSKSTWKERKKFQKILKVTSDRWPTNKTKHCN